MKKVAILGGGFAGLSTAYFLTQKGGYDISLFEKELEPGGLAIGFKKKNWKWTIEQAYHHLFTSDTFATNLSNELGIPVIFKRPLTTTYTHSKIVQLDSPLSLLKFPYLSLIDKVRTAGTLAFLKFNPLWKPLEKKTAKEWLTLYQGQKPWKELWEPLFKGKFGEYENDIAMSWFWARIYKRSASLGYIEGGFQSLAEKLTRLIIKNGVNVQLNTMVTKVANNKDLWDVSFIHKGHTKKQTFDFVIATIPMPLFLKLFPKLPDSYQKMYSKIEHLHALNLLLELKKPFLPPLKNGKPVYWININDTSMPFLAVVEHTNFMDKKYYGNNHLVYVGNYLPYKHPFFEMNAQKLFKSFKPHLDRLSPGYDFTNNIVSVEKFIGPFAQPVVTKNYSKIKPPLTTPLKNVYVGNLDSIYPWDRGTNYAIELGKNLSSLLP